jgi:glycosyltransferase involved in cell wall biosynthesis
MRLAIVVSHPIQYYTPLYRRLAKRDNLAIKVFFTWHAGRSVVHDHGFKRSMAWDIPLTEGYDFESVPNTSSDPGTHHFLGLRNPSLFERVAAWRPDVLHVTGWAWLSHLQLLRACFRQSIPTLFRGDSNLLDRRLRGPRWWVTRSVLRQVYSWPTAFLFVGEANRAYYEACGVDPGRLFHCPHSIDVTRFAEPIEALERLAAEWRQQLGIRADETVLLFAGKFEVKKRPIELMRAVQKLANSRLVLVMAGAGELEDEVKTIAARDPDRFRVLPFQNQSQMPIVYRLGDIFILPSAFGETWGLAVNEALACGRPVIVSDRVGCAADVVVDSCGRVLPWTDILPMVEVASELSTETKNLQAMRRAASERAWAFDITQTEDTLINCLAKVCAQRI